MARLKKYFLIPLETTNNFQRTVFGSTVSQKEINSLNLIRQISFLFSHSTKYTVKYIYGCRTCLTVPFRSKKNLNKNSKVTRLLTRKPPNRKQIDKI